MRQISQFSAVIGASSLLKRRSGVGRMTLEMIEAVRPRFNDAALALLVDGRLRHPDAVLTSLPNDADLSSALPHQIRALALRAKGIIAGVPGAQKARSVKQHMAHRRSLAALRSAGGGRVVYHEPNMITEPFDGPTVVTVNDLSWHHHPDHHPKERLKWIGRHLRRSLDGATRYVAISHFTFEAMIQELGLPADRIDIVPLAAAAHFTPKTRSATSQVLVKYGLMDRQYILSVSTLEPRKNLDRLFAAHASLPDKLRTRFPLVIVGGDGWGSTLSNPAAERAFRTGLLRVLGYVPEADLVSLYARASAFAYVSVYEGFGLPVLEAMAAGTPVLASCTTGTGETAGAAAAQVDPFDVDAIAVSLRHLVEDRLYAKRLSKLGLRRAAEFSWDRTATELIASWSRALG